MPGSGLKPKEIRSVKKNAKKIKFIVDIKGVFMYNMSCVRDMANVKKDKHFVPGCGSAWLERLIWDQEVAGSNPVTPTYNPKHC